MKSSLKILKNSALHWKKYIFIHAQTAFGASVYHEISQNPITQRKFKTDE